MSMRSLRFDEIMRPGEKVYYIPANSDIKLEKWTGVTLS